MDLLYHKYTEQKPQNLYYIEIIPAYEVVRRALLHQETAYELARPYIFASFQIFQNCFFVSASCLKCCIGMFLSKTCFTEVNEPLIHKK